MMTAIDSLNETVRNAPSYVVSVTMTLAEARALLAEFESLEERAQDLLFDRTVTAQERNAALVEVARLGEILRRNGVAS